MRRIMINFYPLILGIYSPGFNIDSFVSRWNNSTLRSIMVQQRSASIPNSVRTELEEAALFFPSDSSLARLKIKDSVRRLFVTYTIKNNLLPLKSGGVIIERASSGEQRTLDYYLLTKNNQSYLATRFSYASEWQTKGSALLSSSYVDSLATRNNCYFQGHNGDGIIVTEFTQNGENIFSQFFTTYSFCTLLNKLDSL